MSHHRNRKLLQPDMRRGGIRGYKQVRKHTTPAASGDSEVQVNELNSMVGGSMQIHSLKRTRLTSLRSSFLPFNDDNKSVFFVVLFEAAFNYTLEISNAGANTPICSDRVEFMKRVF